MRLDYDTDEKIKSPQNKTKKKKKNQKNKKKKNFLKLFKFPTNENWTGSPTGSGHPVVLFVDLVNARDRPSPERRKKKQRKSAHIHTHTNGAAGWMDGLTSSC